MSPNTLIVSPPVLCTKTCTQFLVPYVVTELLGIEKAVKQMSSEPGSHWRSASAAPQNEPLAEIRLPFRLQG